jgi:hypothetical protein
MSVACLSGVCGVWGGSGMDSERVLGWFWAGSEVIWGLLVWFPMTGAVCLAQGRVRQECVVVGWGASGPSLHCQIKLFQSPA